MKKRVLSIILALILSTTMIFLPTSSAAGNQNNPYQLYLNKLKSVSSNLFPLGTPVAFSNVCGDSTPEMLYITRATKTEYGYSYEYSILHIVTYRSGMLSEVFTKETNFGRSEGLGSYLAIWGTTNTVATCESHASEDTWADNYTIYKYSGTNFGQSEMFSIFADPFRVSGMSGGNEDGIHFLYGSSQKEISESAYNSYYGKIKSMGNPLIEISVVEYSLEKSPCGMNYAKAVTYLENMIKIIEQSVGGFYDVQISDWYASDVKYAVDKMLMNGISEQYFSPNGKTTRGQAVTILYRLAGSPSVSGDGFSDVKSSDWFYKAVQWASKNGIASGYGNGRFGPNDTLNREQLATMLYRYAQVKKMNTTTAGGLSKFSDSGSVSGYALDAMSWAVSKGLISGTSDGKLTPGSTATRAQLAAILHRFCENVK